LVTVTKVVAAPQATTVAELATVEETASATAGCRDGGFCAIDGDSSEVGEAVVSHDLGDAQAVSSEWSGYRLGGVGVLENRAANSRVDEGNDTTESGGRGESRVRADGWDGDHERVEVLLSGDEATCCGNGSVTRSEGCDNVIGLGEF
jgi:hypothetical protein